MSSQWKKALAEALADERQLAMLLRSGSFPGFPSQICSLLLSQPERREQILAVYGRFRKLMAAEREPTFSECLAALLYYLCEDLQLTPGDCLAEGASYYQMSDEEVSATRLMTNNITPLRRLLIQAQRPGTNDIDAHSAAVVFSDPVSVAIRCVLVAHAERIDQETITADDVDFWFRQLATSVCGAPTA